MDSADNPLILEAYGIPPSGIPTSVSAGYMQTTGLADGSAEAGLEANVEAEHYYLASIHQVYELMLETLDDDFCPRPSLLATDSAVTITEQVARRREPGRISKATSRVDLLYIWSQWGKFRLPQLFPTRPRLLGTGHWPGNQSFQDRSVYRSAYDRSGHR